MQAEIVRTAEGYGVADFNKGILRPESAADGLTFPDAEVARWGPVQTFKGLLSQYDRAVQKGSEDAGVYQGALRRVAGRYSDRIFDALDREREGYRQRGKPAEAGQTERAMAKLVELL